MKAHPSEDFDTLSFEKRLTGLGNTQDGIQSLSSWCLAKRGHHKKIVSSWLNVLKRARVDQRLTLFYLANDVIQYSKRKNYEFVDSWGTSLQKATPLVRDDKIKHKILRIFRIWEERQIYNDEFLTDLTGLLSVTAGKQAPDVDPNDFQAAQLVNKIRQCSVLEADTDQQLKQIHESAIPLNNAARLTKLLKERRDTDEAKKDLDQGVEKLEGYVRALQKELVARAALCRLLQKAHNHYAQQRGEVKVVANAYKNFGNRVRTLKRKLEDMYDELPNSPVPSPPSPADAVPSPGPDEDLDLPAAGQQDTSNSSNLDSSFLKNIEKNLAGKGFGTFVGKADFSISSFQGNNDTNKGAKKIEVISNRPVNSDSSVNIHSLLNSLIPNKPPPSNDEAVYKPILNPPPPPPPFLPGLDLLGSDRIDALKSSNRPVNNINFYGTRIPPPNLNIVPETNLVPDGSVWNNTWDMPSIQPIDTPESPPVEQLPTPPPPPIIPVPPPAPDVDHRQLLAPPPGMPQSLMQGDDIDHRRLPPLPPSNVMPSQGDSSRSHKSDVDHRNLIPLTMGNVPPPPAPPMAPWPMNNRQSDQDYRSSNENFSTSVPPPLPLMSIPPPIRRITSHVENAETSDMEMSDEENHEAHEDDYNRHIRLESSMARIHGHPPPPLPHHITPPPFRNQDSTSREKTFMNNRNNHPNDKPAQRTNLVCINSGSDNYDNKSERQTSPNDGYRRHDSFGDNVQSPTAGDIFSDFPNNAMNPINPNSSMHEQARRDMNASYEAKNEDDWERDDDDNRDPWPKRAGLMNPIMPNFPRPRMFNQRPPPSHNFRRPPPLLSTPLFPEEPRFNPPNSRGNNFRRPRGGHHRQPRGGYW